MGEDMLCSLCPITTISEGFSKKNRSRNSWKVISNNFASKIRLIFPCHRCHLGGMMYDLWESLLLESEIESKVNEKK